MTVDLYAILGIAKDASPQTVHIAYRVKTKRHHPDAGGDRKAWDEISLAHDILSDPDRRAKYDATGSVDPSTPDNSLAELIAQIATAFDTAMTKTIMAGENPIDVDMIGLMIKICRDQERSVREANATFEKTGRLLSRMLGRFETNPGVPNHIETMLRAKIADIERLVEGNKAALEKLARPRIYLEGCRFIRRSVGETMSQHPVTCRQNFTPSMEFP